MRSSFSLISFFTIGEVAEMIGESVSLLRFWEKEFPKLNPSKTEGGTRKYSRSDVTLIKMMHHLVKTKGLTLEGAREHLAKLPHPDKEGEILEKLRNVRGFLDELRTKLK